MQQLYNTKSNAFNLSCDVEGHGLIMKFRSDIAEQLFLLGDDSINEVGGLLGSTQGFIVDCIVIDREYQSDRFFYTPNTTFLNHEIQKWIGQNIQLIGLFHTHYYGVTALSEMDKRYISLIMASLPQSMDHLLFPIIVFPGKEIVCYRANRKMDSVQFTTEELEIVH